MRVRGWLYLSCYLFSTVCSFTGLSRPRREVQNSKGSGRWCLLLEEVGYSRKVSFFVFQFSILLLSNNIFIYYLRVTYIFTTRLLIGSPLSPYSLNFLPSFPFLFKPTESDLCRPSPLGCRAISWSMVDQPEAPPVMKTASSFLRGYQLHVVPQ